MNTSCRAVQFSGVNEVECVSASMDPSPEAGELLLRSHYTCISAGTELAKLTGLQPVEFPLMLGNRAVTEVVAVGSGVDRFEEGDLVLSYSAHAELARLPAGMVPGTLPRDLDAPETAMLGMAMVAQGGVCVAEPAAGQTAVVTGGGLVGQFAAQLLGAAGVKVVLVESVAGRRDRARACGVEHVVDPGEAQTLVNELTDGAGVEVVLECTGIPSVVVQSLPLCRQGGTMVLVGSPRGECVGNLTELLSAVHICRPHGDLTLKGAHEWKYPVHHSPTTTHSHEQNLERLVSLVQTGKLRLKPLLSKTVSPENAATAYHDLAQSPSDSLGIVFDWT